MKPTVTVFYISGQDRSGAIVDLAKFFRREDAEVHLKKYPRISVGVPYTNVGIGARTEALADQHSAHREALADAAAR